MVVAHLDDVGIASHLRVEVVAIAAVRVWRATCAQTVVVNTRCIDVGRHIVRVIGTVRRVAVAVNVLATSLRIIQIIGNALRAAAIGVATRFTSIHEGALPYQVSAMHVCGVVNCEGDLHSPRVSLGIHHDSKVLGVGDCKNHVDVSRLKWAGNIVLSVQCRGGLCTVAIGMVSATGVLRNPSKRLAFGIGHTNGGIA